MLSYDFLGYMLHFSLVHSVFPLFHLFVLFFFSFLFLVSEGMLITKGTS